MTKIFFPSVIRLISSILKFIWRINGCYDKIMIVNIFLRNV